MTPTLALALIGALVAFAALAGTILANRTASVRVEAAGERLDPEVFAPRDFGSKGTVIQFSTAYCTRCPGTERIITESLDGRRGVEFIHIDVTARPELASRFRLNQTPTVLILDPSGTPRTRLAGPLSRETLASSIETTLGAPR
ncbi:TlpA family protein disulfide reductase [Leucobacter soli]|uniref:Thioredoxin domain-containing protein n=1 Tax=Leucobacter soli TaxID=2812850 RepID=A0A916JY07_9MICO|nr:thioredoxin family protein [Leucobacter soli]CAG7612701.1 hypothetical protein LEUCIP111803_01600 [Leucobacter soli]